MVLIFVWKLFFSAFLLNFYYCNFYLIRQLSPKQDGIISEHKARIQRDLRRAKRAEVISTSAVPIEMHPQSTGAVFVDDSLNATIAGVSFASVAAQQDAEDAKLMDCDTSDVCSYACVF